MVIFYIYIKFKIYENFSSRSFYGLRNRNYGNNGMADCN